MDPISTVEKDGYIIEIHYDTTDCTNPREWENTGRMVCSHKRYNLGDSEKTLGFTFQPGDFDSWDAVEKWLEEEIHAFVTVPMSMTDHSGLFIEAGRVRGWDSGQIGFAYMTEDAAKAAWSDLSGAELVERARQCLLAEIEEYSDYVAGNVYCYRIRKKCDSCGHPEVVESGYGYIGDGGAKDAMQEALSTVAYLTKKKEGSIGADTQTA